MKKLTNKGQSTKGGKLRSLTTARKAVKAGATSIWIAWMEPRPERGPGHHEVMVARHGPYVQLEDLGIVSLSAYFHAACDEIGEKPEVRERWRDQVKRLRTLADRIEGKL